MAKIKRSRVSSAVRKKVLGLVRSFPKPVIPDIAQQVGLSKSAVYRIVRDSGINLRRMKSIPKTGLDSAVASICTTVFLDHPNASEIRIDPRTKRISVVETVVTVIKTRNQ